MLRSGHIFLNASLTEAYCMAIVEAASCGLQVVSTRVGGIPEVLPPDLIHLTDATVESLYNGLLSAIRKLQNERKSRQMNDCANSSSMKSIQCNHNGGTNHRNSLESNDSREPKLKKSVLCPYECNEVLRRLYNWNNITERTERVYQRVLKEKDPSFGDKLNSYLNACIPFVLVVSFSYLLLKFLDIIEPRKYIDFAVESPNIFNKRERKKNV